MLKHLFSLTCMNKKEKEKKKLAITNGSAEQSVSLDDTLDKSMALPTEGSSEVLDTSQFMSKVAADVSMDAAKLQNRATPIDFCTREVSTDDDIFKMKANTDVTNTGNVGGRRRSDNPTPSPIPEEPGVSPISPVFRTPKPRKQAKIYHSPENSPIQSMKSRSSSYAINQMYKGKLTPVIGGSLRPPRSRRHSVAFDENAKFYSLDRRNSHCKSTYHVFILAAENCDYAASCCY